MEEIKSYISTLIIVSITTGAINILAPDGSIKKYIKYLISLTIVIILLLPFKDLIYTIPKMLESYQVEFDESDLNLMVSNENLMINYTLQEIKNNIKELLSNRFMIKIDDIEIEYSINESVDITKIIVYSDCNDLFASDIRKYLSDVMYCEIKVVNKNYG